MNERVVYGMLAWIAPNTLGCEADAAHPNATFLSKATILMFYRTLADLVALTHFAFIVFALCGGLLALRWRWVPFVHIPAAAWGVTVELFGWFCPLTPLENWLRRTGGSAEYSGGFIERYLLPLIYPEALTRELQIILGLVLVLINLGVYFMVWRRYKVR